MSSSVANRLGELSASLVEAVYVSGISSAHLSSALRTLRELEELADPRDRALMAELGITLQFVRALRSQQKAGPK